MTGADRSRVGVRALGGLLVILIVLALGGCGDEPAPAPPLDRAAIDAEPAASDEPWAGRWARSCALCHVDGTGGAPRVGQANEWRDRIAQGEAVLLQRTLQGYNNMPPLGYCMDCTRADFLAMIRMMAGPEASP